MPPERYKYQEFPWYPATTLEKAIDHINYGASGLHLGECLKSRGELETLLDAMRVSGKTKALFVPKCNIDNEGCNLIANFIREDRALKYLFIEENKFDDDGAAAILAALEHNRTLKTVMMGNNKLGDKTAKALGELLAKNTNLYEVSIGKEIGGDGAVMLAKGLNSNHSLRAMYLLDSPITTKYAKLLSQVVSRHPSCTNMEIDNPSVTLQDFQQMFKHQAEEELKEAFERAVRENSSGPWMRSKIAIVGQGRSGKTATVRSLLGLPFNPALESTVGASISQSTTKNSNNEWTPEGGAKARFDFTRDTASRIAAAKIAMSRNKQAEEFEKLDIQEFMEQYNSRQEELEKEREAAIEAAKANAVQSAADEEVMKEFKAELITNKNGSLDDIAFTLWDYGGQKVFYTMHHLFLTKYGIYLLTFDMREVIAESCETDEKKNKQRANVTEYLQFWLNSIKMHAGGSQAEMAAPIMIFGTFFDEINSAEDIAFVKKFLLDIIKDKFDAIVWNGDLPFFPLSNKSPQQEIPLHVVKLGSQSGRNIEIIRDKIESTARGLDFVTEAVSIRWMKCLDAMLAEKDEYLMMERVSQIAKDCNMLIEGSDEVNTNEVQKMLKHFHERGMVIYLDSNTSLNDRVVTKPQWLVDNLSKIIRDPDLHPIEDGKVKTARLQQHRDLLITKSVVTSDWLDMLLKKEDVPYLTALMVAAMLISKWEYGSEEKQEYYLVPSLVTRTKDQAKITCEAYLGDQGPQHRFPSKRKERAFLFDFSESYLPNGVFQRLVCIILAECETGAGEPELYENYAVVCKTEKEKYRLYKTEKVIMVLIEDNFSKNHDFLGLSMLKLRHDVMGEGLKWKTWVEQVDGENQMVGGESNRYYMESAEAREKKVVPWFSEGNSRTVHVNMMDLQVGDLFTLTGGEA